MTNETIGLARTLWDYLQMKQPLKKADAILVLGSHDTRVAERGAELFLEHWAPLLIFSGGLGRLTSGQWSESEAARFADIAKEKGVPEKSILIEDKSSNTGENILFTKSLVEQKKLPLNSFILVQKPYMERRSYATFKKQWPGKELIVTSPQLDFDHYPTGEISLEKVIQVMTGDLQRIRLYAAKGYQIHQEIPDAVWQAFEKLVALGFDQQLIKS